MSRQLCRLLLGARGQSADADMAVGDVTFDAATLATLDASESRSNEVLIG